jgi:ABC-type glycerol-3-phosphate transport system permease component
MRKRLGMIVRVAIALAVVLIVFGPLMLMFATSLKSNPQQILVDLGSLRAFWVGPEASLDNYRSVLSDRQAPFLRFMFNSILIVFSIVILGIFANSLAAYVLSRLRFTGRKLLLGGIIALMIIPVEALVVPLLLMVNRVGWLDTYQGMITVYFTFSLPFAIWLLVSYMEDIPREMEEAAFLDKAGRFRTLWYVILPQVRGGIAVTTVLVFLNAWNEFLFAVQLSGNAVRPVTVAMYNFVSVEQTLWGKLSAAALVAMLPVIAIGFAAQKQIVKGLTVGAVKGGGRR